MAANKLLLVVGIVEGTELLDCLFDALCRKEDVIVE